MAYFGKEFSFEREENFDAFADFIGAFDANAKGFMQYKPNQILEKNGDSYKLIFKTPALNHEVVFKSGVPYSDVIREGLTIMAQSPDIMLSQYAQDPLEGFTQEFPELCSRLHAHAVQRQVKKPKNKKGVSKRRLGPTKSYVITKNQKGKRLIKIEVIDIVSDTGSASSSEITDQEDNVLISAQYVVQDSYDEIMDLTDNLVQKISKKLCGDNF